MLSRLKFDISELVDLLVDQLPEELFISSTSTFYDPAMAGGQFLAGIVRRLAKYNHSPNNIASRIYGMETNQMRINYARNKQGIDGQFYIGGAGDCIYDKKGNEMKFDCVIGNPPYQDGSQSGGNNKIYNQFCKKAIKLAKDDGSVAFITPTSVLKKSKRFSLAGQSGLKLVDFTAGEHFDVGVKICSWIIDKQYKGDITVTHKDGTNLQPNSETIYDYSEVDKNVVTIYENILKVTHGTNNISQRMFQRNNHGPAFADNKSSEHIYDIISIVRGEEKNLYTKRIPYGFKQLKLILPNTKALTTDTVYADINDYGPSFFVNIIENDNEIENIKSFVLSEYFIQLYKDIRILRGGMNSVLVDYCPVFDKTKLWTNDEVRDFFERFLNED